jgi:GMP synthase-like glutamine amidotransferase
MIIDVMQHGENDGLGSIAAWAQANDIELHVHRLDAGDDIRALNQGDMDGIIILDGPMSVNDDDDWLAAERILVRSMDKSGRPVFGIGLGAEQIVRAFGAPVFRGRAQSGFAPVTELATNREFTAFHLHDQRMAELPGATQLYTSNLTANLGFKYHAHILGMQFNLEVTPEQVQALGAELGTTFADSQIDYDQMHAELDQLLTRTFL